MEATRRLWKETFVWPHLATPGCHPRNVGPREGARGAPPTVFAESLRL